MKTLFIHREAVVFNKNIERSRKGIIKYESHEKSSYLFFFACLVLIFKSVVTTPIDHLSPFVCPGGLSLATRVFFHDPYAYDDLQMLQETKKLENLPLTSRFSPKPRSEMPEKTLAGISKFLSHDSASTSVFPFKLFEPREK